MDAESEEFFDDIIKLIEEPPSVKDCASKDKCTMPKEHLQVVVPIVDYRKFPWFVERKRNVDTDDIIVIEDDDVVVTDDQDIDNEQVSQPTYSKAAVATKDNYKKKDNVGVLSFKNCSEYTKKIAALNKILETMPQSKDFNKSTSVLQISGKTKGDPVTKPKIRPVNIAQYNLPFKKRQVSQPKVQNPSPSNNVENKPNNSSSKAPLIDFKSQTGVVGLKVLNKIAQRKIGQNRLIIGSKPSSRTKNEKPDKDSKIEVVKSKGEDSSKNQLNLNNRKNNTKTDSEPKAPEQPSLKFTITKKNKQLFYKEKQDNVAAPSKKKHSKKDKNKNGLEKPISKKRHKSKKEKSSSSKNVMVFEQKKINQLGNDVKSDQSSSGTLKPISGNTAKNLKNINKPTNEKNLSSTLCNQTEGIKLSAQNHESDRDVGIDRNTAKPAEKNDRAIPLPITIPVSIPVPITIPVTIPVPNKELKATHYERYVKKIVDSQRGSEPCGFTQETIIARSQEGSLIQASINISFNENSDQISPKDMLTQNRDKGQQVSIDVSNIDSNPTLTSLVQHRPFEARHNLPKIVNSTPNIKRRSYASQPPPLCDFLPIVNSYVENNKTTFSSIDETKTDEIHLEKTKPADKGIDNQRQNKKMDFENSDNLSMPILATDYTTENSVTITQKKKRTRKQINDSKRKKSKENTLASNFKYSELPGLELMNQQQRAILNNIIPRPNQQQIFLQHNDNAVAKFVQKTDNNHNLESLNNQISMQAKETSLQKFEASNNLSLHTNSDTADSENIKNSELRAQYITHQQRQILNENISRSDNFQKVNDELQTYLDSVPPNLEILLQNNDFIEELMSLPIDNQHTMLDKASLQKAVVENSQQQNNKITAENFVRQHYNAPQSAILHQTPVSTYYIQQMAALLQNPVSNSVNNMQMSIATPMQKIPLSLYQSSESNLPNVSLYSLMNLQMPMLPSTTTMSTPLHTPMTSSIMLESTNRSGAPPATPLNTDMHIPSRTPKPLNTDMQMPSQTPIPSTMWPGLSNKPAIIPPISSTAMTSNVMKTVSSRTPIPFRSPMPSDMMHGQTALQSNPSAAMSPQERNQNFVQPRYNYHHRMPPQPYASQYSNYPYPRHAYHCAPLYDRPVNYPTQGQQYFNNSQRYNNYWYEQDNFARPPSQMRGTMPPPQFRPPSPHWPPPPKKHQPKIFKEKLSLPIKSPVSVRSPKSPTLAESLRLSESPKLAQIPILAEFLKSATSPKAGDSPRLDNPPQPNNGEIIGIGSEGVVRKIRIARQTQSAPENVSSTANSQSLASKPIESGTQMLEELCKTIVQEVKVAKTAVKKPEMIFLRRESTVAYMKQSIVTERQVAEKAVKRPVDMNGINEISSVASMKRTKVSDDRDVETLRQTNVQKSSPQACHLFPVLKSPQLKPDTQTSVQAANSSPVLDSTQRQPNIQRPLVQAVYSYPVLDSPEQQPDIQRPVQACYSSPVLKSPQQQPDIQRPVQACYSSPILDSTEQQPDIQRPAQAGYSSPVLNSPEQQSCIQSCCLSPVLESPCRQGNIQRPVKAGCLSPVLESPQQQGEKQKPVQADCLSPISESPRQQGKKHKPVQADCLSPVLESPRQKGKKKKPVQADCLSPVLESPRRQSNIQRPVQALSTVLESPRRQGNIQRPVEAGCLSSDLELPQRQGNKQNPAQAGCLSSVYESPRRQDNKQKPVQAGCLSPVLESPRRQGSIKMPFVQTGYSSPVSKSPQLQSSIQRPPIQAGYSPPVLPIPSYEKTLEFLLQTQNSRELPGETDDDDLQLQGPLVISAFFDPQKVNLDMDRIRKETQKIEISPENRASSNVSNADKTLKRKISLDEYKKRSVGITPQGDQKIKTEVKSEDPSPEHDIRQSIESGYDSDSTVKL